MSWSVLGQMVSWWFILESGSEADAQLLRYVAVSDVWWPRAATSYFTSNYAIVLIIFCNYFKKRKRKQKETKKLRKNKLN